MRLSFAFWCVVVYFCVTAVGSAQDAVKADPKHYKVELENAQVRVLRAHYGPHEKSVMHSHPDAVAVYLSNGTIRFTLPDGKTVDAVGKKGQAVFTPAQTHNPENTGDTPFDVLVIELKGKAPKASATK